MSSALVRYGARAALPYVGKMTRYGKRINLRGVGMAARVIQRVYRNRKKIGKFARGVKRMYRGATRMGKRMRAVQPRQHSQAKSDTSPSTDVGVKLGTMVFNLVNYPNRDLVADHLGARQGLHIFLKGIRFCRSFEFIDPDGSEDIPPIGPIMMHWALVQLKDADMDPAIWDAQFRAKFFRVFNDLGDREQPFIDNFATSGWNALQNCSNMNPDAEFNILTHKRKIMNQARGVYTNSTSDITQAYQYHWRIDRYIKFKKKIAYSNINSTVATHPMFEIFWYQTLTPTPYSNVLVSASLSDAQLVRTFKQHTVYYHNVRP